MKTKAIVILIGILITILGMGMFCFGVSMFTYQGHPLSAFMSKAGEYAFIFWLPTIITGLAILIVGVRL